MKKIEHWEKAELIDIASDILRTMPIGSKWWCKFYNLRPLYCHMLYALLRDWQYKNRVPFLGKWVWDSPEAEEAYYALKHAAWDAYDAEYDGMPGYYDHREESEYFQASHDFAIKHILYTEGHWHGKKIILHLADGKSNDEVYEWLYNLYLKLETEKLW